MSNKGRRPSKNELQLWTVVKKTVKPLRDEGEAAMQAFMEETSLTPPRKPAHPPKPTAKQPNQSPSTSVPVFRENHLDGRTLKRLQKGEMKIEGELDMHGMRQDEAHTALNGFVTKAFQARKRCVMVITGKGSRSDGDGILKSRLPVWLSVAPLNTIVLRHEPAIEKHGGSGAFYLYLKRQKTPS